MAIIGERIAKRQGGTTRQSPRHFSMLASYPSKGHEPAVITSGAHPESSLDSATYTGHCRGLSAAEGSTVGQILKLYGMRKGKQALLAANSERRTQR